MGVTGLWTVVAPTARPTSLASLNRKRLAVDASIWIYQFLKAVRDKEGNALRNSHVVGFFRRICKLLYFGIKPVFVFDGGAPALKRETVVGRRRRREGRRDDAVRTAAKLISVQMERAVEEQRQKEKHVRQDEEELPDDAELVYVDEIGMDKNQRQKERREGFRKKDQYHLPDLDVSIESMRGADDPRIMSQQELEEYARQFHSGEDINLYDFSKIDFESPFFLSLPAGDRYNILNAARLRSRLRMGYSKEQLDGMFPDRMAFSRFQIERVKERNELTQRLMHINGMTEFDINQGGRIAGEKGKEYVLVRNEGVEGGWALGVVSNREGSKKEDAIDLEAEEDDYENVKTEEDEDEFEDVAIEGLNRLPKTWKRKRQEVDYDMSYEDAAVEIAKKRKAVYAARKTAAQGEAQQLPSAQASDDPAADADTLFVQQDTNGADDAEDDLFEDVDIQPVHEDEDDDLQRAIALSLEAPKEDGNPNAEDLIVDENDEDDGFDLQAALAASRKSKYVSKTKVREASPKQSSSASAFSGPLPFESLNLGQSLLGKKKAKKVEEGLSGGFDRDLGQDAFRKEKKAQPMPSWFDTAPSVDHLRTRQDDEDGENYITLGKDDVDRRETLRRKPTKEIIDLEAEPSQQEPVDVSSDEEKQGQREREVARERHEWEMPEDEEVQADVQDEVRREKEDQEREDRYRMAMEIAGDNADAGGEVPEASKIDEIREGETTMGDIAEEVQANPPQPSTKPDFISPKPKEAANNPFIDDEENQGVQWSDSDAAEQEDDQARSMTKIPPAEEALQGDEDEEAFEDVDMPDTHPPPPALVPQESTSASMKAAQAEQYLLSDDDEPTATTSNQFSNPLNDDQDYLSGSDAAEEEELMRQLAIEAEEHARFASSLNPLSTTTNPAQAARDYESELKSLRSQQARDRRDADEVTQTMILECQALLRLFGLPYITAPMEAEAQCAALVQLNLVDGIVTDDSDIFLFGGTRIYKNMFNAAKFVECYLASDLEKEYALDREKLIRFAHLLGSDYTEGIPGIGPVTALEIITDFPSLSAFSTWCSAIQLGRPSDLESQLTTPFRRKLKSAAQKRIFLPPHFPDSRVDQAYLKPEVDDDPQPFEWGVPDLDKLRSFLMATIGWSQERTDEVLVPVVRDMNRREAEGTQSNITRFFDGAVGVGVRQVGNKAGAGGSNAVGGDDGGGINGKRSGNGRGDAAAPRNRTGKESGRMENAYKRLRGEAERKRRRVNYAEDDEGAENDGTAELGQATERLESAGQSPSGDQEQRVENVMAKEKTRMARKGKGRSMARRKKAAVDDDNNDDDNDYDFAAGRSTA